MVYFNILTIFQIFISVKTADNNNENIEEVTEKHDTDSFVTLIFFQTTTKNSNDRYQATLQKSWAYPFIKTCQKVNPDPAQQPTLPEENDLSNKKSTSENNRTENTDSIASDNQSPPEKEDEKTGYLKIDSYFDDFIDDYYGDRPASSYLSHDNNINICNIGNIDIFENNSRDAETKQKIQIQNEPLKDPLLSDSMSFNDTDQNNDSFLMFNLEINAKKTADSTRPGINKNTEEIEHSQLGYETNDEYFDPVFNEKSNLDQKTEKKEAETSNQKVYHESGAESTSPDESKNIQSEVETDTKSCEQSQNLRNRETGSFSCRSFVNLPEKTINKHHQAGKNDHIQSGQGECSQGLKSVNSICESKFGEKTDTDNKASKTKYRYFFTCAHCKLHHFFITDNPCVDFNSDCVKQVLIHVHYEKKDCVGKPANNYQHEYQCNICFENHVIELKVFCIYKEKAKDVTSSNDIDEENGSKPKKMKI